MILNEIAQWIAIAFMAVFLVGLTRQLGRFMSGSEEVLSQDVGPALGDPLPAPLRGADGWPEYQERIRASGVVAG